MAFVGYAAKGPKAALERFEYEPHPLGPYEIELSITHCGICHSDLHLIDDDWGISEYPLLPGHEIVGEVAELGNEVRSLEKGDRVGIGWQRSSCGECPMCIGGDENLCATGEATCVRHHGGFADAIRADSRFAFRIPEPLSSENAGPLLCGGITVYSPLRRYNVRPPMKVGVIGIGGLGHLALQFASAFGCEVTAFSSSPEKEDEARFFGADHFVNSRDKEALEAAAGSQDFILSTVHVDLDWSLYLNALRMKGNLCFVGANPGNLEVPTFGLILGAKSVSGSPIGGRAAMHEMLEFAARHGIEAKTEVMPMNQVNEALDKVRHNLARYRMVLKN